MSFSESESTTVKSEIESILQKSAFETVPPCQGDIIATLFLFTKKCGGLRPVIKKKFFNQFVERIHYKMESIQTAIES